MWKHRVWTDSLTSGNDICQISGNQSLPARYRPRQILSDQGLELFACKTKMIQGDCKIPRMNIMGIVHARTEP